MYTCAKLGSPFFFSLQNLGKDWPAFHLRISVARKKNARIQNHQIVAGITWPKFESAPPVRERYGE
jgi:hypothetical protein